MKDKNLTEGSIFQKLIGFSLPMIAGNMLQQIYNLADTYIVGNYLGPDALASVGSSYTLMVFLTSIIIGLCMGSGVFFSTDYGASDERKLKEDIRLSFWFILAVTCMISILIYPLTGSILRLLRTPTELVSMTREYVTVMFAGLFFVFLYNFFAFLLRAMGNSVVPLIFLAISSVLNILLDIWLVAGLKLHVGGAALATILAQAIAGVGIMVYALIKLPILKGGTYRSRWNSRRLKQIIVNDVATGIQQSVMNFGILMIQGLVNSFGTDVMASFAAAVKIDTLAYMPAQEFGNAYSLFVSQNYGARKPERIKKGTRISLITSTLFCMVVSFAVFVWAEELMGIFIDPAQTRIVAEGVRYLRIEGAMYVGIGVLFLWYGYFRGINRPRVSLILTILSLGTRVLLSYSLAPHTSLGVVAIWMSVPTGWILADIVGFFLYHAQNHRNEVYGKKAC